MPKKYIVKLTKRERKILKELITSNKVRVYKQIRARILLKADERYNRRIWTDEEIAEALEISIPTVERIRKKFILQGLDRSLSNDQNSRRPRGLKIDGETEAHLIALACSSPPEGRNRWTLRLLASRMVELSYVKEVSYETVRRTLKKTNLSLG